MKSVLNICIQSNKTLFDALKNLENGACQIVLVIDSDLKLLGTISDGDIRRHLITGKTLTTKVNVVMNTKFISVKKGEKKQKILQIMKEKSINQIPVIDESGKILEIVLLKELIEVKDYLDNPVLIMAGGLGSRLMPFTKNCPKPMLKVGSKPILEILLEQLIENGFTNFYFSVNYLKEQIIEYFEDGSKWSVDIQYLIEENPLGTAGALSLLPEEIKKPFIVINGDILTKFNMKQLIEFHNKNKSHLTICAREYEIKVPFGVIETNGIELKQIIEKPVYKNYINAGVYTFSHEILKSLQKNQPIDMPELIEKLQSNNKKIVVCPIHEYWIDIGRHETLNKAYKSWVK
tara:strand:- start:11202 stop:12245 length:1044 start_codon:yes stop_codon:yes gene_type:complete